MKILIVDDEQPARQRLHELVQELGHNPCGEAANGREALAKVQDTQPDVVLLDIRMPVLDGLETARYISQLETPPAVIFTTAFEQHALEAFEAKALDYLLKPVRKERLAAALERAQTITRAQLAQLDDQLHTKPAASPTATHSAARSHLCVKIGNRLELIPLDDVYYFQADQKYVTLCHRNGEAIIEDSLKALEQEFGERFLRIHRNALAALAHIRGLEKTPDGRIQIVFDEIPQCLEVSRRHASHVRRAVRSL